MVWGDLDPAGFSCHSSDHNCVSPQSDILLGLKDKKRDWFSNLMVPPAECVSEFGEDFPARGKLGSFKYLELVVTFQG